MEQSLEGVAPSSRQHKQTYRAHNRLRREMVGDHPVYSLLVSGSSTGSNEKFFCRICHRDVSMRTCGAVGFSRHYFGERHWCNTGFVRACLSSTDSWIQWNCLPNRFLTFCLRLARVLLRGSVSPKSYYLRAPPKIQRFLC